MTTILLVGKNGQLGWELGRALVSIGQVAAFDSKEMDLTDRDAVSRRVHDVRPDIIVNAGAYTAVDKAETEPDLAMRVNGVAPGMLAEEAKRLGALLVHYSTDYVFDGEKQGEYVEEDVPNPLSAYGRSKLAGEQAIEAVGGRFLILRTSWVYGMRGNNFLLTMLRLGRERSELKVVDDQIGAPTSCRFLADATSEILRHVVSGQCDQATPIDASGIFHLTLGGSTSWHGFAETIFRIVTNKDDYAIKNVAPIKSHEWPSAAKRPKNSVLSTNKVRRKFGLQIPSWMEGLNRCLNSNQV